MKRLGQWVLSQSLWLASIGLMLASSGLDGRYMAQWMSGKSEWLGYVLNTVSDVSGLIITYWFGRLQQSSRASKRFRLSYLLLPAEVVAVGYSWFFGWRQLLGVMILTEPDDYRWVAPLSAAFIPLMLAFIGLAQSLLAGKLEETPAAHAAPRAAQAATQAANPTAQKTQAETQAARVSEEEAHACAYCGRTFGTPQAVSAHLRHCTAYQDAQNAEGADVEEEEL